MTSLGMNNKNDKFNIYEIMTENHDSIEFFFIYIYNKQQKNECHLRSTKIILLGRKKNTLTHTLKCNFGKFLFQYDCQER